MILEPATQKNHLIWQYDWDACGYMGATPKMVGFPNNTHGFSPTKNDQHLGCEMEVCTTI